MTTVGLRFTSDSNFFSENNKKGIYMFKGTLLFNINLGSKDNIDPPE